MGGTLNRFIRDNKNFINHVHEVTPHPLYRSGESFDHDIGILIVSEYIQNYRIFSQN